MAAAAKPTRVRFGIMVLLFITVVINYLDRSNLSIAAPAMAQGSWTGGDGERQEHDQPKAGQGVAEGEPETGDHARTEEAALRTGRRVGARGRGHGGVLLRSRAPPG